MEARRCYHYASISYEVPKSGASGIVIIAGHLDTINVYGQYSRIGIAVAVIIYPVSTGRQVYIITDVIVVCF